MYKIIGADQKEYGPSRGAVASMDYEGRVNGADAGAGRGRHEWKALSAVAEFTDVWPSSSVMAGAPPVYGARPGLPEDLFTRDYDWTSALCGRGVGVAEGNFGLIFGGVAISCWCKSAWVVRQIPNRGHAGQRGQPNHQRALTGGVYYFLLKNIRQQPGRDR